MKTLQAIELALSELQISYVEEDDEIAQLEIVRRFTLLLQKATEVDGVERLSAGVTINNWTPEE